MGVLGGLVNLHPFPGLYCQGLLKDLFSAFTNFMIWCLLFCVLGYSVLLLVLTRLRIVARHGKFFDRPQSHYTIVYFAIALFIFVPVPGMLAMSYRTREEMEEFVRKNFPNNIQVLDHPGVHIFMDLNKTGMAQFVTVANVILGFSFVVFIYMCIYRETRVNSVQTSTSHIRVQLKKLYKMIWQTTFIAIFMTFSCLLIFKSFFNDPFVDPRISNAIAYSSLCAGSIPYQILMISRNTAYKDFVMRRKNNPSSDNNQQFQRTIIGNM